MAIHRILQTSAVDSDFMSVAVIAYEQTCRELHLTDHRYSPANELVALKVVKIIRGGERDVQRVVERALAEFRAGSE
jgi:hypothetical protein